MRSNRRWPRAKCLSICTNATRHWRPSSRRRCARSRPRAYMIACTAKSAAAHGLFYQVSHASFVLHPWTGCNLGCPVGPPRRERLMLPLGAAQPCSPGAHIPPLRAWARCAQCRCWTHAALFANCGGDYCCVRICHGPPAGHAALKFGSCASANVGGMRKSCSAAMTTVRVRSSADSAFFRRKAFH